MADEHQPLLGHSVSQMSDRVSTVSRSSSQRRMACMCILLIVALERLAYYGITCNLVIFLNAEPFMWQAITGATTATFIFLTVSFVSSLVSGIVADSWLGRYTTIVISLLLFIVGSILMCFLAWIALMDSHGDHRRHGLEKLCYASINFSGSATTTAPSTTYDVSCTPTVYVALVLIAWGAGSIRSNLSPFGAEQVKDGGPEVTRTFFNWYYWAINLGSLIAYLVLAYIQQNINFFDGFIGPLIAITLCLVVFGFGRIWFVTRSSTGSVLWNTFRIIWQAFRRRSLRSDSYHSSVRRGYGPLPSFMDMAKLRFGGSFHDNMVEDVKALGKVILVLVSLVPYWMVYYQMQTTFIIQGLHLKITTVNDTREKSWPQPIPVAWISLFNIVAVLLMVPLMDRIFFPWLEKRGYHISLMKRILIGMIFSIVAVVTAGVLELARRGCYHREGASCVWIQYVGTTTYFAADISIFAQVPQYALIGISEVFASVAGLEFAYSQAPRSMQGLIMGLFCLSNGLGVGLGLLILMLAKLFGWISSADSGNINNSHLEFYFFLLAGIQLVGTLIFAVVRHLYGRSTSYTPRRNPFRRSGGYQSYPEDSDRSDR